MCAVELWGLLNLRTFAMHAAVELYVCIGVGVLLIAAVLDIIICKYVCKKQVCGKKKADPAPATVLILPPAVRPFQCCCALERPAHPAHPCSPLPPCAALCQSSGAVAPGATWQTIKEARLRVGASPSSAEVGMLPAGLSFPVVQVAMVDGHRRGKIGAAVGAIGIGIANVGGMGRWVSLVTAKGATLCVQVSNTAPVTAPAAPTKGAYKLAPVQKCMMWQEDKQVRKTPSWPRSWANSNSF